MKAKKLHDAVAWRRLRVLSLEMIAKFPFRECFSIPFNIFISCKRAVTSVMAFFVLCKLETIQYEC